MLRCFLVSIVLFFYSIGFSLQYNHSHNINKLSGEMEPCVENIIEFYDDYLIYYDTVVGTRDSILININGVSLNDEDFQISIESDTLFLENEKINQVWTRSYNRTITLFLSDNVEVNSDLMYFVEKLGDYFKENHIKIIFSDEDSNIRYFLRFGDTELNLESVLTGLELKEICDELIELDSKE